jgi:hypothetical protein
VAADPGKQVINMKEKHSHNAFTTVAVASIIAVVIGAAMLFIGLFTTATLGNTFDPTLNPAAARGTLTFTGNVTCGEFVNITAVNGTTSRFRFNVTNIAGWNCPIAPDSGQTNVSVPGYIEPGKTMTSGANNLTTAINANGTLLATMVASAGTDFTTMSLTYLSTGTTGNDVIISETITNASWNSGTRLAGGVIGTEGWQTAKNNVNTTFVLLGIITILGGAIGLIGALSGLTGRSGIGR